MKAIWYRIKFPASTPKNQWKRVRSQSKNRSVQMTLYRKRSRVWLARPENRYCGRIGCTARATDVHHSRGRIGALLLDERFWIPICRECHVWIHQHPAAARNHGLLAPVGQWNVRPK